MPTVQAPFAGGVEISGATIANTVGGAAAPDAPTVITEAEVLEPTVRAPEMLEPPTMPPAAMPVPGEQLGTVADDISMEMRTKVDEPGVGLPTEIDEQIVQIQTVVDEPVEVTITTINESPAKLIVTRNGQSREFLLKKPDISIGRAPSNDIALSGDQLASRRHALIHFDGVNYVIRDLVSANGTYINGVELRAPTPLSNGDHVGVGEHELIFFSVAESAAEPTTMTFQQPGVMEANPETIPVPGQADTIEPSGAYRTQGDSVVSGSWEQDEQAELQTTTGAVFAETEQVVAAGSWEPTAYAEPAAAAFPEMAGPPQVEPDMPESTIIERIELTEESSAGAVEEEVEEEEEVHVDLPIAERLRQTETVNEEDMPLPVPQLPEIPTILSAIQSLDSTTAEMRENLRQAKALEAEAEQLRDQLRAATEAISGHDNSVAVLAQRMRVGVADVSNRLTKIIDEVQRADESLSIADMMKLIDDVRNDPRDIYTLGSLARRARELAQFFEMHQHVNQILSECLSTLNDLLSPDLAKPEAE
jgi:pSer/pThr/pTyr-binding forkhead associated (FHA) protein